MRRALLLVLLLSVPAIAKDHAWVTAKVLGMQSQDGGTNAMILPMGTGLIGATAPRVNVFYNIQIGDIEYIIHNYATGGMSYRWVVLTVHGETQGYVDGKYLHIRDTQGKDRKCTILAQKLITARPPADASHSQETAAKAASDH